MKTDKNILFIATTPLCVDGLTSVLVKTAEIVKERFSVAFALGEKCELAIRAELCQIGTVYDMPSRKRSSIQYYEELKRLIREQEYHAVYIHGNSATMALDLLAARQGGAQVRITHCHNQAKQSWIKSKTLGLLMNRLVTIPVACSQASGEALYSKSFQVIRNGVDVERFRFSKEMRRKIRSELGIQDAFVIGHIGRFSEQKNHKRLISVFEKVLRKRPEAVLLLCGAGELEQSIRQEVVRREIEDKVYFMGVIPDPEDYLMAMDVFVMTSFFEGLPLVGLEAQAAGLPCVFAESITEEVAILPETDFISLNESDELWAESICRSRDIVREEAAGIVEESGYGIDRVKEQVRAFLDLLR